VSRLILVRHGRAAAGWDVDIDPGLDDVGRAQAEAMRATMAPRGPLPIVVSPLRRTRETAAVLEQDWSAVAVVDPAVGEIPTPIDDLKARATWLRGVLAGEWVGQDGALRRWREAVIAALLALDRDTVVVTHFVAINVAVGAATADDRVVSFPADHCSQTVVDNEGGGLRLVQLGASASTQVL
jgi:broad specificity phosphatase PhoE